MALRFTLSLPVTAAVNTRSYALFRQAVRLADADHR
jgi:hypothetical protein